MIRCMLNFDQELNLYLHCNVHRLPSEARTRSRDDAVVANRQLGNLPNLRGRAPSIRSPAVCSLPERPFP